MGHRLDTALQPGETLLANCAVQFPSGDYKRLIGFRSFRDFQGRDISAELPGWPPSSDAGEPPAKGSAKGVVRSGLWTAAALVQFTVEGLTSGGGNWPSPASPGDRDDYPVLRADPGTLALGAPWQLDPGRNKTSPRVVLHVTDRRLLFTDPGTGGLLWQIARRDVRAMTPGTIVAITFTDDSWIRIMLVKDKDALIPDSDRYYRTTVVGGEPTRVPLTRDPHLKFAGALKDFLAAPAPTTD